jgi:hypothetical protein
MRIERPFLSSPHHPLPSTYLEVDDDQYHHDSAQQVAQIGCILSVEGILQGIHFVALGQHEVEQCNNGSLKFSALVSSNCHRGETLPQDVFTDVGGYEK